MYTESKIFEVSSMRRICLSLVRKALSEQRGQVLPLAAMAMVAMMGMAGLTIDVGHAYVVRSQLQNSTNAAALAAAGVVYNTSSTDNATTYANNYSSGASGNENFNSNFGTVHTAVTTRCLNLLVKPSTCAATGNVSNAVQVTQSASVPTYFMRLFGFNTLTVSATAIASMQGIAQPWNVAIIVDATQSMSNADTNCGGMSEFQCALNGIQALLEATDPCPSGVSSCTAANANFRVSLFSFPNLSTANLSDDNPCGGSFTKEQYTFPLATSTTTSYSPITYQTTNGKQTQSWAATYQIVDWDSSYYEPSATATAGLNPNDNLVKVIGNSGTSTTVGNKGCLPNVGGESTYYAGVIYAAQAALVQEQANFPGSQNAMILLSDGQANADSSKFPQSGSTVISTFGTSTTLNGLSVTNSNTSYNLTGGTFGTYPDYHDECQQAIMAAQAATQAGTTVYAVAYGSEDSGCTGSSGTDTTLVATGTYNVPVSLTTLTPCITMEDIASSIATNSSTFYSDYLKSGGSGTACQDASHSVTSLQGIFQAISATFTYPRLLPNNAN